jgi:polar amino acid transport system permease protein
MKPDDLLMLGQGLLVTIEVTIAAAVLAAVVSLVAGMARTSRFWVFRVLSGVFIEVFRGTSALVQLYVAFFVLPYAGIELSPFIAGTLVLGLNVGSYGAEVVRAGIAAVPIGQLEAATALDLPAWARFRHIILPQAMLIILRPAGNLFIGLLLGSSLVSLVTLADLTYQGNLIRLATGSTAEVFLSLLVIYFLLSTLIAKMIDLVERRLRRGIDPTTTPKIKQTSVTMAGAAA